MSVQRGPVPPVGYLGLGFTGRMSNAMHQAACAVGLARRFGTEPILGPTDWPYRPWLSLPDSWFPENLPAVTPPERFARHLSSRARPYLQDLSIWAHCADEIREVFSPSHAGLLMVDEAWATLDHLPRPIVGTHIRRGDVQRRNPADSINVLPASYYLDAVAMAQAESVVCFTDDPLWVAENLPPEWLIFKGEPGPEDWEDDYATRPRMDWLDMAVMARCQSAVISNSTYGWWSAWLGQCDTYYPSRWFGVRLKNQGFDESLILPQKWTKVETT